MEIKDKILNKVLEVNRAFYNAFAAGDFFAVKEIWAKGHQISVVHPGSAALHGQKAVMMSWELIFENAGPHDIDCTNEKVYLMNESAYVVCSEVFPEGQLIATNIFVIEDGAWRMVHHQAGPNTISDHDKSQTASNVLH